MEKRNTGYINALHIYTLFAFAVVQPLFDLLARNATFFSAHDASIVDLLVMVVLVALGLPALLVFVEMLVDRARPQWRDGFHLALVGGLVFLICLPPFKEMIAWLYAGVWGLMSEGFAVIVFCVLATLTAILLYKRCSFARSFVTLLSVGVVGFPAAFLIGSPITQEFFSAPHEPQRPPVVSSGREYPPVIMIVFDEFNGMSILNEQHRIDRGRFPNFARLADDATWFRNATTNDVQTHFAIPAQLTGRLPDHKLRPFAIDHPDNLFTLLSATHQLRVRETDTRLCTTPWEYKQEKKTQPEIVQSASLRMAQLVADAAVVYTHIVTPKVGSRFLPGMAAKWGGFVHLSREVAAANARPGRFDDRAGQFRQFVKNIKPADPPAIYFYHCLLPHVPYEYLPSGKTYFQQGHDFEYGIGITDYAETWTSDELRVLLNQQRYLLQLQFVDLLVGELIDHLQSVGMYDKSLIVLTSDHGVAFRPRESRRRITRENQRSILPILCMMKLPQQKQGTISDRNVESIDVLPTIADCLKVPMPWPIDGQSAFDETMRPRPLKTVLSLTERFQFDGAFPEKYESVQRRIQRFSQGEDELAFFCIGPHPELIGRKVDDFDVTPESKLRLKLLSMGKAPANASQLDCMLWGRVIGNSGDAAPAKLAIAVNGTVRAVTRTYQIEGWEDYWAVMLPEEAFNVQRDKLEIFVVSTADGRFKLARAYTSD